MAKKRSYSQFSIWLVPIVLACLKPLAYLPYSWQLAIGRFLGRSIQACSARMRRITRINLKLCFPELDDKAHARLLKQSFESLGIGFFEGILATWGTSKRLDSLLQNVKGIEHIEQTLKDGHGVLLLFPHIISVYLVGRLFLHKTDLSFSMMYHSPRHPSLNKFMYNKIAPLCDKVFNRKDLRTMVKHLKENNLVWFAPDLDLGRKNSLFVPFFDVPAATVSTSARLAHLTGAKLIPIDFYRRPDDTGYDIEVLKPLPDFSEDEEEQCLLQINQAIEATVRKHPEQYLWQYKRFNTRPEGDAKLYKRDDA